MRQVADGRTGLASFLICRNVVLERGPNSKILWLSRLEDLVKLGIGRWDKAAVLLTFFPSLTVNFGVEIVEIVGLPTGGSSKFCLKKCI